jgi:5-methylcytosine-specific restriction protein A
MSGWDRRGPRRAFSAKQRRIILARDRGICHVCGGLGADEADHVIPLAEGGEHGLANGAAIHAQPCHETKSREESARGYARRMAKLRLPEDPHPFQWRQ